MISFKQVVEYLADFNAAQVISIDLELLYKGVGFLSGTDEKPRKGYLYIGNASELSGQEDGYKGSGLLIAANCDFDTLEVTANIALFPAGTDLIKLFNAVQSLFDSEITLQRNSAAMLSLLTKGKNLQEIIQETANMLENPVLLPDSSGRLIAVSSDKEIPDPVSMNLVSSGYVTGKFIQEMQSGKLDIKIMESQGPILFDYGPFKDIRRIVSKIIVQKRTVAYLLVLETERRFREEDYEVIRMICDVISLNMSMKQSLSNYTGEFHEHLMIDLLNENETDSIIQNAVDTKRWNLTGSFSLVAACAPSSCADDYLYLEYLRMRVRNLIPACKSVYYDRHLVLLLNRKEGKQQIQIKTDLEKLFLEEQLAAGESIQFTNIMDIKKYYIQAVKSIELGQLLEHQHGLFEYEDYYVYDLLNIAGGKTDLKDYCHQSLEILLRYDMSNGTDYFETLHEYLKHAMNKTRTADILYIHRNTMDHRIRKISELTGMDLADGEDCFKLFLSYKIYRLVNKITLEQSQLV